MDTYRTKLNQIYWFPKFQISPKSSLAFFLVLLFLVMSSPLNAGTGAAVISSPANLSTLTGSSVTFSWNNAGALGYGLQFGTSVGSGDIETTATLSATTYSYTKTGLPTNGSKVHVRMWTWLSTGWVYNDYSYTAWASATPTNTPVPSSAAVINSPTNHSTLSGSSVTFTWNNSGALGYGLQFGASVGAGDLETTATLSASTYSYNKTGLPANGSTVYVRLWTWLSTGWVYNDYSYTAFGSATPTNTPVPASAAVISSPANHSTLSGSSVTFTWNNAGALGYGLQFGTSVGAGDLETTATLSSTTYSYNKTGLPANGSTVYVRLWTWLSTGWVYNDYSYTAWTAASPTYTPALPTPTKTPVPASAAVINSPTNHTALSGSSVTFTWNNSNALGYGLQFGTSVGAGDLETTATLSATTYSYNKTGLPTNGSTVYVRLWTWLSTGWVYNDYSYTAAAAATATYTPVPPTATKTPVPASAAVISSPTNHTVLSGSSVTFTWNNAGALGYGLQFGTSVGAGDLETTATLSATTYSYNKTGLPTNGSPVYVRLWTWLSTGWVYNDYSYTAWTAVTPTYTPVPASAAVISSPTNHTALSGSSVTFTWNNAGALGYGLQFGSSVGAGNLETTATLSATTYSYNKTGLPTNGSTVYVRLWTWLSTSWVYNDYSYTAWTAVTPTYTPVPASAAVISSPTNHTTLSGSSVTFTWNNAGALGYGLQFGTSVGAGDLETTATLSATTYSYNKTGLPTNGSTVYVRLWTWLSTGWVYNDYSYTAATISIPTPTFTKTLTATSTFTPTPAETPIIPVTLLAYNSEDYKYQIFSSIEDVPLEISDPLFDDQTWETGIAGFGIDNCSCGQVINTLWPESTAIVVRKHFNIGSGINNICINVAIDNDVVLFFNGYKVSENTTEGCGVYDKLTIPILPEYCIHGDNLIVAVGVDRGGAAILDMKVTGTYSAIYTSTPTPIVLTATPTITPIPTIALPSLSIDIPGLASGAKPLEMVLIPAGSFIMGSSDTELDRESYEGPQHQVTITQPYYMGKYEVTQAQWKAVMGSNHSTGYGAGNDKPVYYVSWDDCQTFINALNMSGQGTFRLPTEAEWEYACRAGTSTRFYWGDDLNNTDIDKYAWYFGNNTFSPYGIKEVGLKLPNAWGLFDMSGNVYEWCEDWVELYPSAAQTNPAGPSTGLERVLRGGSWSLYAKSSRSADRGWSAPDFPYYFFGFRLVRSSIEPTPTPTSTATNTPTFTPTKTPTNTPTFTPIPPTATPAFPGGITKPAAGSVLYGSTVNFEWDDLGMVNYGLVFGTSLGANDLGTTPNLTSSTLSYTKTGLPTNSGAVYVRFWVNTGTTWKYKDYTYSTSALTLPLHGASGETILGLGTLNSIAYSPNGQYIATTGKAGSYLWQAGTGNLLRAFIDHSGTARFVTFSPDSSKILTLIDEINDVNYSTGAYYVKIWDVNTASIQQNFPGYYGAAAFSPDGSKVALAGGQIIIMNTSTWTVLNIINGPICNAVAFSPDGSKILTGSYDKTATLWDVSTGANLRTFTGHTDQIRAVAFSPDGTKALTGGYDLTAILWDVNTGTSLRTLSGIASHIHSLSFSPDGSKVLTSGEPAKVWDTNTWTVLRTFSASAADDYPHNSAVFSPDGSKVLTMADANTVKLWDANTGSNIRSFTGHTNSVNAAKYSPDGNKILTGYSGFWDKKSALWTLNTWVNQTISSLYSGPMVFSPDGNLIFSVGGGNTAKLWNAATGADIRTFSGHTSTVYAVAISPDGTKGLTGSYDNTAKLWNMSTGAVIYTFSGHAGSVESAAFSPDGNKVLTGGGYGDYTAKLWNANTGAFIRTFSGHTGSVYSVAFSPDGSKVLTGGGYGDNTAKLWNANTGDLIHTFSGHGTGVESAVFSPDGNYVLTGSGDHTAKLWDANTGAVLHTFYGHGYSIREVAFSPDGKKILTGSGDGTARVWDFEIPSPTPTPTYTLTATFTQTPSLTNTPTLSPTLTQTPTATDNPTSTPTVTPMDTPSPAGTQIPGSWSLMNSGITTGVYGVWGFSNNEVYTSGENNVLHFNGSVWTPMNTGLTATVSRIWGSSGTDLLATSGHGKVMHYNGSSWNEMQSLHSYASGVNALWGYSSSDVFAGGDNSFLSIYDGSNWTYADVPDSTNCLTALWGTSHNNTYAVTSGGIWHYDGSSWTKVYAAVDLCGIWGTSGNNIYCVGANGLILHYNGASWSSITSPTANLLDKVRGNSANNIFAVGASGTIIHYDGVSWKSMTSNTSVHLYDVWVSSQGNAYAVGDGGVILQYSAAGSSPTPSPISVSLANLPADATALTMVYIPAGTFIMGSLDTEQDRCSNEGPQHQVTLTQPFYLGQCEVTQAQWKAVIEEASAAFPSDVTVQALIGIKEPSYHKNGGMIYPNRPVEQVSWEDCQNYIYALNLLGKGTYRLPSEAEWEYACRAGTTTRFYWGNDPSYTQISEYAWKANNSGDESHDAGTKLPNAWGLYDMSGNVWEFNQDLYGNYSAVSQENPTGANTGSTRAWRGGSWLGSGLDWFCRSANRNGVDPDFKNYDVGFRLVKSLIAPVTVSLANLPADATALTMVYIPAGTFIMGSPDTEQDRGANEGPQHQVTLTQSFYLGQCEVTQAQWKAVIEEASAAFPSDVTVQALIGIKEPSYHKNGGLIYPNRPVEQVSWEDCQNFIYALNLLGKGTYRLPSEAEWEYACRAGTTTRFYWGDDPSYTQISEYAWKANNSGGASHDAGTKLPNAWGLYDMSGNVWEFNQDLYGNYSAVSQENPTGANTGSTRAWRGGSWLGSGLDWFCRSANRNGVDPDFKNYDVGFRLVATNLSGSSVTPTPTPTEIPPSPTIEPTSTPTVTPTVADTPTPSPISVSLANLPADATALTMVYIPAGTFIMGSTDSELDRNSDEGPQHQVTITQPFYLGQYEVTQAQWKAVIEEAYAAFPTDATVMELNEKKEPSGNKNNGAIYPNRPVETVSWYDCQKFIYALNMLGKGTYRLPAEAEWEYACRAGTTTRFYWGDDPSYTQINDYAWYWDNSSSQTHDVGLKISNAWGLYDISGNAFEWCQDRYGEYSSAPQIDPTGTKTGLNCLNRGGLWISAGRDCRSAARYANFPDASGTTVGFRLMAANLSGSSVTPTPTPTEIPPSPTIEPTSTPTVTPTVADTPTPTLTPVSTSNWTWQNPLPNGNLINGVWGSSGDDVFTAGLFGTILHYNGTSWSAQNSGTTQHLNGVWGSSASDVFAVGFFGKILHYNGSSWSVQTSGTVKHLYGVWGSSASNVFAVGSDGTILHYNGTSWSEHSSGVTYYLYSVWGSSASDVFAAGENGTILHYNGTNWSEQSSGTTNALFGIWGSSDSDVFAVGYNDDSYSDGTILHYNGTSWSEQSGSELDYIPLKAVWGSSANNVFAVGNYGMILHYNGTSWSEPSAGPWQDFNCVWGISGSDVFAAGYGAVIVHYDGTSWSEQSSGTSNRLTGTWVSSASDAFAVGYDDLADKGLVLHYNGLSWLTQSTSNLDYMSLNGVWGNSVNDVFVVGQSGVIQHYNGTNWSMQNSGVWQSLYSVWGHSDSDVFAVGQSGLVLHFNGTDWLTQSSGTVNKLSGVWGCSGSDVFAVGQSGTILHYNGTNWSVQSSGTTQDLCGVWGTSPSDVFAVGNGGTILHYNGTDWSAQSSGAWQSLYSVWGHSGSDVFAVGQFGAIFHYNGTSWSAQNFDVWQDLQGVCGSSSGDVFTVGRGGTILHYWAAITPPTATPTYTTAPTVTPTFTATPSATSTFTPTITPIPTVALPAVTINIPGLASGAKPLEMVLIPSGSFTMGSSESDPDHNSFEQPQHQVTLTQSFYMGKYEITQAQWQAVMGSNPSNFKGGNDYPVENVSWNDCQTFITALNGLGQGTFRMPAEAEWEYACRAQTSARYFWGEDFSHTNLGNYAWYESNANCQIQAVGTKYPNPWGLFDMSGNVWEWCQDWSGLYTSSDKTNPTGPESAGMYRIMRGGWVGGDSRFPRSSNRNWHEPGYGFEYLGLRIVKTDVMSTATPTENLTEIPTPTYTPTPSEVLTGTPIPTEEPTEEAAATPTVTPTEMSSATPSPVTVSLANLPSDATALTMVYISAGTFVMGSTDAEQDRNSDEGPQHQVTITQPFYLGQYEVTQAQWKAVIEEAYASFPSDATVQALNGIKEPSFDKNAGAIYPNRPVNRVTWNNCQNFIYVLNMLGKGTYRLPAEAEWEYACRAGTSTRFYWGNDSSYSQIGQYAWYTGNSNGQSHEAGTTLPNAWGLFDMSGNGWEWCQDWYGDYSSNSQVDPVGAGLGSYRAYRGGSWYYYAWYCRSALRSGTIPDGWGNDIGFRLVRSYVKSPVMVSLANLPSDATALTMVYIPAGTFIMGSTDTEQDRNSDESPQHQVTLTQPFYLGQYEVTQAQWKAVIEEAYASFPSDATVQALNGIKEPSFHKNGGVIYPNRPVEWVSWNDCQNFIYALNLLGKGTCCLPTEAQWEFACRAGTTTRFYWGDDPGYSQIGQYAWLSDNSGGETHNVGAKLPNALGLFDMSGNVYEWCQDWDGSYLSGLQADPTGSSSGSDRIFRGGDWFNYAPYGRSADRNYNVPNSRNSNVGFRLLMPLTITPTASATSTPTPTLSPTENLTEIPSPTYTPTPSEVLTGTPIPTEEPTEEVTGTPVPTEEATGTPVPTEEPMGTPTVTPTATPNPITIALANLPSDATALTMVYIPAGTFIMGSTYTEQDRNSNEGPQHQVTLTQPFYMGKYEITQAQWKAVIEEASAAFPSDATVQTLAGMKEPSYFNYGTSNYPVEAVSWNECQQFVYALNLLGKGTCRLPTEAEWEYACRAGTTTRFYWGNDLTNSQIADYAWYYDNDSPYGTKEVGMKLPNGYGLYDMSGNVSEWCQDWYGSYSSGTQVDPVEPSGGSFRVYRGGSWYDDALICRSAVRCCNSPSYRYAGLGLRLMATSLSGSSVTPTPTPTLSPTENLTEIPTPTYTPTPSEVLTGTPIPTEEPTEEATGTPVPTEEPMGTPTVTPTATPNLITIALSNLPADATALTMVYIPAGTFIMGSTDTEQDRYEDEGPQHQVTLTQPFYFGQYEVTQAQWKAVIDEACAAFPSDATVQTLAGMKEPSSFKNGTAIYPNRPVEWVSWNDCQQFVYALNLLVKGTFRIPTEAEWEYACRAGSAARYYWGDDLSYNQIGQYAWYVGNSSSETKEVGMKLPNVFGLYDMSGNVFELCQDWYGASYSSGSQVDPTGPSSGSFRVRRGGGWRLSAVFCRSAFHNTIYLDDRLNDMGLRLVRSYP